MHSVSVRGKTRIFPEGDFTEMDAESFVMVKPSFSGAYVDKTSMKYETASMNTQWAWLIMERMGLKEVEAMGRFS
jgi:hypothetical protein